MNIEGEQQKKGLNRLRETLELIGATTGLSIAILFGVGVCGIISDRPYRTGAKQWCIAEQVARNMVRVTCDTPYFGDNPQHPVSDSTVAEVSQRCQVIQDRRSYYGSTAYIDLVTANDNCLEGYSVTSR